MSMRNEHIGEDILTKYLLGETTTLESEQVRRWIAENEEHSKEFYRFKTIWEESMFVGSASSVDENAAWEKFKNRTDKERTINFRPAYRWAKVAALALLIISASVVLYTNYISTDATSLEVTTNDKPDNPVNIKMPDARQLTINTTSAPSDTEPETQGNDLASGSGKPELVPENVNEAKASAKFINVKYEPGLSTAHHGHTKKYVCNATPCPLEICIIQKVRCPGEHEPAAISTCSVLAPDEAGQLHYKSFEHITKNCDTDVEEIRIKRVSTGETIVLNANSKPATARDFFSYITGEKTGDILAGMFHKDCNNRSDDCGLIYNTDFGSIIMQ